MRWIATALTVAALALAVGAYYLGGQVKEQDVTKAHNVANAALTNAARWRGLTQEATDTAARGIEVAQYWRKRALKAEKMLRPLTVRQISEFTK
jgi:hypothetical protein